MSFRDYLNDMINQLIEIKKCIEEKKNCFDKIEKFFNLYNNIIPRLKSTLYHLYVFYSRNNVENLSHSYFSLDLDFPDQLSFSIFKLNYFQGDTQRALQKLNELIYRLEKIRDIIDEEDLNFYIVMKENGMCIFGKNLNKNEVKKLERSCVGVFGNWVFDKLNGRIVFNLSSYESNIRGEITSFEPEPYTDSRIELKIKSVKPEELTKHYFGDKCQVISPEELSCKLDLRTMLHDTYKVIKYEKMKNELSNSTTFGYVMDIIGVENVKQVVEKKHYEFLDLFEKLNLEKPYVTQFENWLKERLRIPYSYGYYEENIRREIEEVQR